MRPRDLSKQKAQKLSERERRVGLEEDDEAARWLQAHDPAPPPAASKSARKSKLLHQWRQRQQRDGR